jgi:hypothetical protein
MNFEFAGGVLPWNVAPPSWRHNAGGKPALRSCQDTTVGEGPLSPDGRPRRSIAGAACGSLIASTAIGS